MSKAKKYNVFISYSHKDKSYASAIQKSIETLGLPFYKKWQPNVNIFRDERKIPLSGSLTNELLTGLKESEYLIVIASKNSANSTWVKEEILNWHKLNQDENGYISNFNFILIDDVIEWDYLNHDFDKLKTTALPTFDKKIFKELPIWANLQLYCKNGKVQSNNSNYEWEIAKIKGLLLGKKPDEIIDEVSRGKRMFRIILSFIIVMLLGLTTFAFIQRNSAIHQRDIAKSRELILIAEKNIKLNPQLSLILARIAAEKLLAAEGYLSNDMKSSLKRIIKVNSQKIPLNINVNDNTLDIGGIECFAVSPDESKIAIGGQNNSIVVMDYKTFKPLYILNQEWTVSISWSYDSKYIASSGQGDNSVNIWDSNSKKHLKKFLFEDSGGVVSVDWRFNSHQLAFAIANGDESIVKVYDLDKDSLLFEVPGIRAKWSNDGKKLATGACNDSSWSVKIHSNNGKLLCQGKGHNRYIHDISWSNDNNFLSTSSVDDQEIIWNSSTCLKIKTIKHAFSLSSSWSRDDKLLAVGGGENSIKIYDTKNNFVLIDSIDFSTTLTGDKIEESSIKGYILSLYWSKNGEKLISSDRDGSITLYEAKLFTKLNDRDLIKVARSIEKRELTQNEINEYIF